ncbi:MAG: triose-phosphate isomerase, partial [Bdellovibrionota bacterium]
MRQFVIAANWKLNKSPAEAAEYMKSFLPKLEATGAGKDPTFRKVIFFVPAIDLWAVQQALRGTTVGWGAQNCHWESTGAFTGENSPSVIAELATPYTLVGHSERRAIFHETDQETAKKVKALHHYGITPMLCVGES